MGGGVVMLSTCVAEHPSCGAIRERAKDGKDVGVSGGLLQSCACLCYGEIWVMVTYGDWECNQNKERPCWDAAGRVRLVL